MAEPDVRYWFDPVCPYCWLTSGWVRTVARRRGLTVEWRFISLRLLNAHVDYAAQFPPEYEAGHTAGLRLLRVCAAVREGHGDEALGRFYELLGEAVFEQGEVPEHSSEREHRGTRDFVAPVLEDAGLPADQADALDDTRHDATIQAETDEALGLVGKDVGTPLMQVKDGPAFFGPVISRRPSQEQAEELWDHVVGLARFPGFAELKRSLRERPQLPAYGVAAGEVGLVEDWHGGSRRQHR